MKVSELTGAQLDYWVAKAEGIEHFMGYAPSTDWQYGGPIIQREQIDVGAPGRRVHRNGGNSPGWGPSGLWTSCTFHAGVNGRRLIAWHETEPLVAAMRCYVASKFGDEVAE